MTPFSFGRSLHVARRSSLVICCLFSFGFTTSVWSDTQKAKETVTPEQAKPERALAAALLAGIPDGQKIALRPLSAQELGLPPEIGSKLYEDLLGALFSQSNKRHALLTRKRLGEVYDSLEEFYQDDIEKALRAAKADVEIICKRSPAKAGFELSCSAVLLQTTETLARGHALFPVANRQIPDPLNFALERMANWLDEDLHEPGHVTRSVIRDHKSGTQTELTAFMEARLKSLLHQRMNKRLRQLRRQKTADSALRSEKPSKEGAGEGYYMEGTVRELDSERLMLEVKIRHGGRLKVHRIVEIASASVPEHLRLSGPAGSQIFTAEAEAVVSSRLDHKSASRAVRNLARARVIAQALGLPAPLIGMITSESDAADVLKGALQQGLPLDESFDKVGRDGRGERVAVRLQARVVPVGTAIRPAVNATLEKTVYSAEEPIRIDIKGDSRAYIGVFAWGADNNVIRLYPRSDRAQLVTEPGRILTLPRRREPQIVSMPLPEPGNVEDHEAIIIVATPRSIDLAAIGNLVQNTVSGTISAAMDGEQFFRALAAQDPSRMALIVLPYQIKK